MDSYCIVTSIGFGARGRGGGAEAVGRTKRSAVPAVSVDVNGKQGIDLSFVIVAGASSSTSRPDQAQRRSGNGIGLQHESWIARRQRLPERRRFAP